MARPRLRLLLLLVTASALAAGLYVFRHHLSPPQFPPNGSVPVASDDPNWHARHAGFVAAIRSGTLEVVFLGDSLAWGWDDHRDLWAERVTRQPTEFFARGGDATNHLLWRIDHGELDGPPPKLVIVLVGTNNRWVNDDPADIAAGIAAVVERVREKAPTAKVLLLGVLPQGYRPSDRSRGIFAAVNERIARLADGKRVFYHDFGGCLIEPDGTLSTVTSSDGTHLTRRGYERWADALGPLVRGLLAE